MTENFDTAPIIVGVTGHRNIVEEDRPAIKEQVIGSLRELQALCGAGAEGGRAVVMLNGLAQGADMLCAEAAFELGIDVYAVLPREEERYLQSFDNEADKQKLHGYLKRAKRVILAPDIERSKAWMQAHGGIDDDSYEYRQLGVYIAEHCHVLLALWDGKPSRARFGCGTYEVIQFALEGGYFDRGRSVAAGKNCDTVVVWIRCRRQGDGAADIEKTWLANAEFAASKEPPACLREVLKKAVKI